MTTVAPLKSTLRVVEWEELPASAREVPFNLNPLADGVLMAHQREWLALRAGLKVSAKGRRTGITFAEALDDTLLAASRKSAGGQNVFYIGDTKEKGLEFIGYCAKFARVIAQAQGQGVSQIEEFLFEDQDENGRTRHITAHRIRFSSGFQISSLSSRPANLRGLQGKVVIDEAAFHPDVEGVLDAASALSIWGGEIVVISSHNGKNNPFNQLVKDIEAGLYGDDAAVYTVGFDQAVANGLYERVCLMTGKPATTEGKESWYKDIRAKYGPRKAAMREELDVIPRDGGGVCIPGVWIDDAMLEDRPVLRLVLDDSFVERSESWRRAWCDEWIRLHVHPVLAALNHDHRHGLGQDFARHRDFSVICPIEVLPDRRRRVPFVVEMHNVPTRQQEQILWAVLERLPRWIGAAMDAGGNGETLAEYTADRYGRGRVHQIKLSRTWYGQFMPRLIGAFEDGVLDLPRDDNHAADLRDLVAVDGVPMVPTLRRDDLKDPDIQRHGDFVIALALAWYVTLELNKGPVKVRSRRRRQSVQLMKGYA
ncbi:hypothetical protein [Lysobacter sp. CA196]|uniref:hypothetical protein n=1 Tax=Lysobacter sp. CA196 TaxID=3455606 RepID=UPI003F8D7DC3